MNRGHLLALLLITLLFRWQTWSLPLNRDEGMYAYAASRLFDSDFVLYRDLFEHKPPGIQLLYWTMFQFTGESEFSVRLLSFTNAVVASILIYLIIHHLTKDQKKSIVLTSIYSYFSNSFVLEGQLANTEMFMTTFLTAGLYLQLKGHSLAAGLLAGFAMLLKPVAIPNVLLLITFPLLTRDKKSFMKIISFSTGFMLPIVAVLAWFHSKNAIPDFLAQVINFNKFYVQSGLDVVGKKIDLISWLIRAHLFVKLLAIGTIAILIKNWEKGSIRKVLLFGAWFTMFYIGAKITSRNVLHYYFPLISSFILLAAVSYEKRVLFVITVVFSAIWGWYLLLPPKLAYEKTFGTTVRYAYEARDIGNTVRARTKPGDKIFFWYDDPEVLFYSERDPTTKYANTFGIVIPGAMEELKSGLEKNPKVIITYESTEWIQAYLNSHSYQLDTSFTTAKLYWKNE